MNTTYTAVTECVKNSVGEGFKKICTDCGECEKPKNQLRVYAENELAKAMSITNKQAEQILLGMAKDVKNQCSEF